MCYSSGSVLLYVPIFVVVLLFSQAVLPSESVSSESFRERKGGGLLRLLHDNPGGRSTQLRRDLRGLWAVATDLAKANISATLKKIDRLRATEKDRGARSALDDCKEFISESDSFIGQAKDVFASAHFFDANTLVSAAMTYADTCDQGWSEGLPNRPSLLTTDTRNLQRICGIALAILTLLAG